MVRSRGQMLVQMALKVNHQQQNNEQVSQELSVSTYCCQLSQFYIGSWWWIIGCEIMLYV